MSTYKPLENGRSTTPVKFDEHGAPLVCYGCAHSAGGAKYPSGPSGERPCIFCTRNPDPAGATALLNSIRNGLAPGQTYTARYDNGPVRKDIADQYIATDRLTRDLPDDGSTIIT